MDPTIYSLERLWPGADPLPDFVQKSSIVFTRLLTSKLLSALTTIRPNLRFETDNGDSLFATVYAAEGPDLSLEQILFWIDQANCSPIITLKRDNEDSITLDRLTYSDHVELARHIAGRLVMTFVESCSSIEAWSESITNQWLRTAGMNKDRVQEILSYSFMLSTDNVVSGQKSEHHFAEPSYEELWRLCIAEGYFLYIGFTEGEP